MFNKKVASSFLCIFFIYCSFLFAQSLPEGKTVGLPELINQAKKSNPQILAAYNNWIAQEFKIKQVRSLPDPRASFSYFGDNIETKVGPQEAKYGLAQKIPFPGKLGLKGKTAEKDAQMMREKYEATEREIVKRVKFAYYDIWWVDKAIQVTESEKNILSNLERVAREKFETNLTPQQDVIKAQVLISKLIDKLFLLRQQSKSLRAQMNSLLSRPKSVPLGKLQEIEMAEFNYSIEELHSIALENRQELIAANLDIERKEYEESLAKLDYFPDFTLGLNYIQIGDGHTTQPNDGQDAWMGMVSINVPIWFDKLGAQLREKEAKLEASKKNYENVENSVDFEVEDLYFKVSTYQEIVSLYETALIPQTEQSFQAAKTAYETGEVDFLNWLDSERVLLQTRLAYYKAIVDYQKSIAYLERVVGKDL
jgi:outer membrane protein TolC